MPPGSGRATLMARLAGGLLLAWLLAAAPGAAAAPVASTASAASTARAAATDPAVLLSTADDIKLMDHARFESIVASLDRRSGELTAAQRAYLDYLHGWDEVYRGDYAAAIPTLTRISEGAADGTVRFRAGITLVNLLTIAARYKEGYRVLGRLVGQLPSITDAAARQQAMLVAAFLYEEVGQYDLSLKYARAVISENWQGAGVCKGGQIELRAMYRGGRLHRGDPEIQRVVDECVREGQLMFADESRSYAVRLDFDHGEVRDGIALLRAHYDEVQATHYARLIAEYDALLARGYARMGDAAAASRFAQAAIASSQANQFPEPLAQAYEVLYGLARSRGDYRAALSFHERYAAAQIAYLKDVAARDSAYDEVLRETAARRAEIQALSRKNRLLELGRRLEAKQVEATRLYGVILTLILVFIGLWAIWTKRSQLHFKNLSRFDGLTGISNRLHFIERAEAVLAHANRSGQDVCVVLFDLDHFKSINDRCGHATGDFVLKRTAVVCKEYLRVSDIFGRFGGEEFSILLPGCRLEAAREQAEQLRRTINSVQTEYRGATIAVSASFGIACSGASGYELARLLAHADSALYRAKRAGRNCVMAYDPADSAEVQIITHPEQSASGGA
jgi:diguanylate cyclase (GGDEF)-like protein